MQAKNMTDERATPTNERFLAFARRYQAHNPAAGKNDKREALFSVRIPHSSPNSTHGQRPSRSSIVKASHRITDSKRADSVVSHIQRVDQNITFGNRAHAQAEPTATFSEKVLRAILKIGTHVKAENALFSVSRTNAEVLE